MERQYLGEIFSNGSIVSVFFHINNGVLLNFSDFYFLFKNRNDRSVGEELKEEIQKSSPIPTYGFLAMFLTS